MRALYPKTIDLQSKQFATLLFNEFRKSFPKCMESTRSLLSKLQSIEKEGFVPLIKEDRPLTVKSTNIKTDISTDGIKNNSEENEENLMISPGFEGETPASSMNEVMPQVVGFPNWSLAMIRDFIACMDVARRKYASLKDESISTKQNQPRLIPLLINEWKEIYPESSETDKTFLEKIKHLKVQKETIKKYLSQSGLLPRRETPNEEVKIEPQENNEEKFYWNKSMIEDVIKTRDSALKRLGEVQTKGKKVSFHHTWWEEFKKIYPNCSFGKNSLSAHYWKWKKTQNHIDKKMCHKSDQGFLCAKNNLPPKKAYTNWTKEDKEQLLDLAFKLQNNTDQEDLKTKGFGAVLRDEWKLLRPDRGDHPSTLNLLYAKYLKEVKVDTDKIEANNSKERSGKLLVSTWTPEHNRVLRQCIIEFEDRINDESYFNDIFQLWKGLFPNSSLSYKDVEERMFDLRENIVVNTSWNFTPEARKNLNAIFTRVFRQTLKKRRMRKDLIIVPEKKLELASNLHKAFIKKFQDCPLTPSALLNEVDMFRSKVSANVLENNESYKIWTPLMINNMIETRKIALQMKKASPNPEFFNFSQVWHQEFVKLHPECPSTKRNLVRKYKWYKSETERSMPIKKDNCLNTFRDSYISDQVSIPSKYIRKDFLLHIKSLLQESQTSLPPLLPPRNQLFNSENDSSSELEKQENQDSNSEDTKTQECFRFPGGAKLIPIHKKSVDIVDSCHKSNADSNYAVLSVLKIPSRVENRLQELDLSAKDFHDLLSCYTIAREEYINYLNRGYLAFFPFALQVIWFRQKKDSASNYPKVNGRNLTGLIEMFLEEFYSCRSENFPPLEFITTVPCKFNVTELTLKQVISCFAEAISNSKLECSKDVNAYESWKNLHPKINFSFKELVSLHRMLIFESNQDIDLLENLTLDCAISEIWFQFAKPEDVSSKNNIMELKPCTSEYDESNISMEQHKEWYFRTKFLPYSTTTSISKLRPHFKVKNIKLFWSNDRIQDLNYCYQKAEFRFKLLKQRKHYQKKISFLNLIHLEWRKLHPELKLDSRILIGKYISHLRRRKKENNSRENIQIQEWNLDVHNFIRSENKTIIESTSESEYHLPGNPIPDFDNNYKDDMEESSKVTIEEVLRRIDEKGKRSVVWTSDVMRDLLKAREESRRKKKDIDKDVRLQKVDNLFLEEWKKVRPKLSHLSIWTLNAYVRKFDQFKNKIMNSKQLKKTENSGIKSNTALVKYFPNTCIPVYDIALVRSLSEVSKEVKDLIFTRQRAMEVKVIDKSNYTLDYLWPIEWKKIYGVDVPANHLKNKLWSVERFPANMERLQVALYRGNLTYETIHHPCVQNDSYMPILPRRYIFPEEQIIRTPFRFSHKLSFHDSSFGANGIRHVSRKRNIQNVVSLCSELSNHKEMSLEIPKVKFEKQIEAIQDDHCQGLYTERGCELYSVKLQPKRTKMNVPAASGFCSLSYDNSGAFFCNECGKKFRNINNYKYHVYMH
ncbi:uncharacterized protein [Lepeophtheirus salmonis]|uniref:uncharacterized protein n=1 Tax=Lepeophtheirus salmonis TaxID=72036 RepID=UPI001AE53066|nr:uncharacterized protein LOC121121327 [Lepeophtheirus salmonis]